MKHRILVSYKFIPSIKLLRQQYYFSRRFSTEYYSSFLHKGLECGVRYFKEDGIKNFSYHQLNRCYRTTVEIIGFANKIFKKRFPKNYKLPEAVLRHGDKVLQLETEDEISNGNIEDVKNIAKILNNHFDKGAATCAIICRGRDHAKDVVDILKKHSTLFNREIISFEETDYKTGIQVLPIEKAKGLEFDTVILVDVDSERYPDTELSTRLFYVGITRALHHLVITRSEKSKLYYTLRRHLLTLYIEYPIIYDSN